MRVAFYARVSSQRQEVEETIETQIMAVRDFLKANNHTLIQEYRDDGWSGTILARPALDQLRLDATKRLWDGVVVYDPDRLSRKFAHQELVIDELQTKGIEVLFVTTPPVKNEGDKLLYGVKGLFAEYERSRIAERFRLGKLRKAREGHVVTSHAPYGYAYIPKQGEKHGYFEVIQDEAEIVKNIFHWIADDGMTIRQVVKKLQDLGVKPRKSTRGVWNNSTLVTLLRSETYYGQAHFNKTVGIVPENPKNLEKYRRTIKSSRKNKDKADWVFIPCTPIIEKALFEKAQKQLQINYDHSRRNRQHDYLISNLIRCTCGCTRTGEGAMRGKHLYYRCSDPVIQYPLPRKCFIGGINARITDDLVWSNVKKLMSNPKLIKAQVNRHFSQKSTAMDHTNEINRLESDINKLAIEEDRYAKAFGQQVITLDQLQRFVTDLRLKKVTLEQRLAQFTKEQQKIPSVKPTDDQIQSFCHKVVEKLEVISYEKKRNIVLKVIDHIVADQEKLCVYGHLPLKEADYVGLWSENRDCRARQRGEVDAV